jgi:hypothetical protein
MESDLGPQMGKVVRIGPERRFGYVKNASGSRTYIFVVGHSITHRDAAKLQVGSDVRFDVTEKDTVLRLSPT